MSLHIPVNACTISRAQSSEQAAGGVTCTSCEQAGSILSEILNVNGPSAIRYGPNVTSDPYVPEVFNGSSAVQDPDTFKPSIITVKV